MAKRIYLLEDYSESWVSFCPTNYLAEHYEPEVLCEYLKLQQEADKYLPADISVVTVHLTEAGELYVDLPD